MRDGQLPQAYRFAKDAYPVLAFAIEHMLTVYYHRGLLCQRHAKRKQLKAEDVRLGELLGNPDLVLKSLQDCQETQIQEAKGSELLERKKRRRLVRESSAPKTPVRDNVAPRTPVPQEPSVQTEIEGGVFNDKFFRGLVKENLAWLALLGDLDNSRGERQTEMADSSCWVFPTLSTLFSWIGFSTHDGLRNTD